MSAKIKIVADAHIPFLKGAMEEVAEVIYLPGKEIDSAILKDADALLTRTRTLCDESLLKGTKVKFIAAASIGYDHIDTSYCDRSGIRWCNAPGCNSSSVEQYILSVLLTLADRRGFTLSEKTIGIVGVGHVGSKVERISRAIGMKVLLNDPPRARKEGTEDLVSLERIQKEADIITMHVPLNRSGEDKTFHLGNEEFFKGLQQKPIVINSSRGEVVDGEALKKAVLNGSVSDAILDVWEKEPEIDPDLLKLTAIATAHIAGYSTDGKANATGMSIRAISSFFGLGMDQWQAVNLPEPGKSEIIIDATGMKMQDLLLEVSRQTYDVERDDLALRKDPEKFEALRAAYPVRREPRAFTVRILNDQPGAGPVLEELGYQVLIDSCI